MLSFPTAEINQEDMRQPIDFFSTYFGWDTWDEISQCTNSLSKMLHFATAKEVAQFVGIHIAMGTLKVCDHTAVLAWFASLNVFFCAHFFSELIHIFLF